MMMLAMPIKVLSLFLISGAVGLEAGKLYGFFAGVEVPAVPFWIVGWGRFAIAAHLLEGILAAVYAPSKQRNPLMYGLYTFFVGTIGLVELLKGEDIRRSFGVH